MPIWLYDVVKSFHLLAVIAFYAGMMYLPRLFVYHHQSKAGGEAEGFFLQMEQRLMKGIINPSIMALWVLGVVMLVSRHELITQPWFLIKIAAVIGVSGLHGFYAKSVKAFAAGERPRSEKFWRIMNEIPFILLIIVVLMVIVQPRIFGL